MSKKRKSQDDEGVANVEDCQLADHTEGRLEVVVIQFHVHTI